MAALDALTSSRRPPRPERPAVHGRSAFRKRGRCSHGLPPARRASRRSPPSPGVRGRRRRWAAELRRPRYCGHCYLFEHPWGVPGSRHRVARTPRSGPAAAARDSSEETLERRGTTGRSKTVSAPRSPLRALPPRRARPCAGGGSRRPPGARARGATVGAPVTVSKGLAERRKCPDARGRHSRLQRCYRSSGARAAVVSGSVS